MENMLNSVISWKPSNSLYPNKELKWFEHFQNTDGIHVVTGRKHKKTTWGESGNET